MKRYVPVVISIGILIFGAVLVFFAHRGGLPVLIPSGSIGLAERNLMLHTVFLMLIVVLPVYALIIFIAWHYRAKNHRAKYTPDWEHSKMEELIWWSIPFEIVLVLAALTWTSTHELDPYKPMVSDQPPLTVQVVALPWKWLFIYPSEGIASVNELTIPVDRPVEFQITADAPMNSFWVPALGGQMYAMSGMVTQLYLKADHTGVFEGRSANYSGEGFAQMNFEVRAVDSHAFAEWVTKIRASGEPLTQDSYSALAKPGAAGPVRYYGSMNTSFMDIVHASMQMGSTTPMMPMLPEHHH